MRCTVEEATAENFYPFYTRIHYYSLFIPFRYMYSLNVYFVFLFFHFLYELFLYNAIYCPFVLFFHSITSLKG